MILQYLYILSYIYLVDLITLNKLACSKDNFRRNEN